MILTLAPKSQITSGKLWHPMEIGMIGPPGSPIFSSREWSIHYTAIGSI